MNPIGVMQGRLLPKYKGRYQAHPKGYWQQEFYLAAEKKLDCIEFILDYEDAAINPLLTDTGLDEIINLIKKTGVQVLSVCADYFMEAPLHSKNKKEAKKSLDILINLIKNSNRIGVKDIVIPCVDQSSLKIKQEKIRFKKLLSDAIPLVEELNINLSLETDLAPKAFSQLLSFFNSPNVTVNYDTGNSASLGFNMEEEFNAYGSKISDIHIKDRIKGGGSVFLGTGNANFEQLLELIDKYNYLGPIILQAFRDDEGLNIFDQQLIWIKEKIPSLFSS